MHVLKNTTTNHSHWKKNQKKLERSYINLKLQTFETRMILKMTVLKLRFRNFDFEHSTLNMLSSAIVFPRSHVGSCFAAAGAAARRGFAAGAAGVEHGALQFGKSILTSTAWRRTGPRCCHWLTVHRESRCENGWRGYTRTCIIRTRGGIGSSSTRRSP